MTKIEEVARAIAGDDARDGGFDGLSDAAKRRWFGVARAAIEAMRVPTIQEQKAGLEALAKAGVGAPIHAWAAADCYRAMIDAALNEEPTT